MSDFLFVCCESGDRVSNVIADDLVVNHDYVSDTGCDKATSKHVYLPGITMCEPVLLVRIFHDM